MRGWFVGGMVGLLVMQGMVAQSVAGPVADAAYAGMSEARKALIAYVDAKEKNEQNRYLDEMRNASARVDLLVRQHGTALQEFNSVWSAFKATRDGEIIPLTKAGKHNEAKQLAGGVQADRLANMLKILSRVPQ
ncbi:MAG: hypothetical protein HQM06_12865 [Magnetococcales bacterium]|nr:hypothetical protein [Magnetococcales bacterium]